jgi:hypothetical protein
VGFAGAGAEEKNGLPKKTTKFLTPFHHPAGGNGCAGNEPGLASINRCHISAVTTIVIPLNPAFGPLVALLDIATNADAGIA